MHSAVSHLVMMREMYCVNIAGNETTRGRGGAERRRCGRERGGGLFFFEWRFFLGENIKIKIGKTNKKISDTVRARKTREVNISQEKRVGVSLCCVHQSRRHNPGVRIFRGATSREHDAPVSAEKCRFAK